MKTVLSSGPVEDNKFAPTSSSLVLLVNFNISVIKIYNKKKKVKAPITLTPILHPSSPLPFGYYAQILYIIQFYLVQH